MEQPQQRSQNIPKGIAYMLGAAAVFPVMNAAAKYLSQYYPIPEVIWARTAGQLLFMCLVFMPSRGTKLFATQHLGYQLVCSVMMICATVLFFIGVAYVPLAEAQAITFTSPLIVAMLAFPMLHEQVTMRRWITIAAGFAGTLIVIRPGSEIANLGALLVLLNTVFYALYQVMTKIVGGYDRPETTVTYSALTGTVALTCVVPFVWTTPQSVWHVFIFLSLGLMGGFGHYCVTQGLRYGPVSVISPFNYAQLLGAAVMGFLVFDAIPSVWTWVGSAIIILSGLYMVWGESLHRSSKP